MLSAPFGDLPYEEQAEYSAASSFVSGAGASALVSVIIMLGTNDSKNFNWAPSGKPKNDQQFLKDYRAMVEHFSALTPQPVIYLALPLATGNSPCCSIRRHADPRPDPAADQAAGDGKESADDRPQHADHGGTRNILETACIPMTLPTPWSLR